MKRLLTIAILIIAAATFAVPQKPVPSDNPLTRQWVFVWVEDEPASAHVHETSQVFGVNIVEAASNFQTANPDGIVICAARVGDGQCIEPSIANY